MAVGILLFAAILVALYWSVKTVAPHWNMYQRLGVVAFSVFVPIVGVGFVAVALWYKIRNTGGSRVA